MTGLELARDFYGECRPMLYEKMPEVMSHACAGLCGEGSECFGCDDEQSQDHDFSATFCLWLPEIVLNEHHALVDEVFRSLPLNFKGFPANFFHNPAMRRGPRSIESYYRFFTSMDRAPQTWREWLNLSETSLATAVNGEIFEDNAGIFSAWREDLLSFYPEDIRLKKMAARCMQMAQSGQYNLPRCLQRGEGAAAMLAASRFAEAAISFVFLINKRYMPFYKWAPHIGASLPVMGSELEEILASLARHPYHGVEDLGIAELVEDFCGFCAAWLHANGYTDIKDSWLWAQGPQIMMRVHIPELREMNLLEG